MQCLPQMGWELLGCNSDGHGTTVDYDDDDCQGATGNDNDDSGHANKINAIKVITNC